MSTSSQGGADTDNENFLTTSSNNNNFWELRQYYKTVKRIDNGNKLCSELSNLIHERAEIEKAYACQLKRWSLKWDNFIQSGPEYGTMQSAWMAFCHEADKLADFHQEKRRTLVEQLEMEVKNWQKDHYHKSTLPPQSLKEAKQLEGEFETAQKPWAKRFKRVQQSKKDYHNACRAVTLCEGSRNEQASGNGDQEKKLKERLNKAVKDKEKACGVYYSALKETDSDKERYVADMYKVFCKSQQAEEERLAFFQGIFQSFATLLSPVSHTMLDQIYTNLQQELAKINVQEDLRWWSDYHGAGMEFSQPEFDEFCADVLHRPGKTKSASSRFSFMSTSSSASNADSSAVASPSPGGAALMQHAHSSAFQSRSSNNSVSGDRSPTDTAYQKDTSATCPTSPSNESISNSKTAAAVNDTCRSVRALFDYQGVEEDEISFSAGDVFVKLSDEDQGWSRGVKEGKVGLFPTSYVEDA